MSLNLKCHVMELICHHPFIIYPPSKSQLGSLSQNIRMILMKFINIMIKTEIKFKIKIRIIV